MARAQQIRLEVTHTRNFDFTTTSQILVDGDTPVANLWPVVVEAVRSQTVHDGSGIKKISLVSR